MHAADCQKSQRGPSVKLLSNGASIACVLLGVHALTLSMSGFEGARLAVPWFPAIGLQLSFYFDTFSLYFTAFIGLIGAAVFHYCGVYFSNNPANVRTIVTLILFSISMLGIVAAVPN